MRETWTDERLDDLNKKVEDGFADMRAEFRSQRGEMTDIRGEMNSSRGEIHGEIAALQRLMIQLMVGLFGTMILGFAGLILKHI